MDREKENGKAMTAPQAQSETPLTDVLLSAINEGRVYDQDGPLAELCRTFERKLTALRSERAGERDRRIVRAYCAANDYINAMLNTGITAESMDKIAADYWAAVREV